jgi:hypothetical protein
MGKAVSVGHGLTTSFSFSDSILDAPGAEHCGTSRVAQRRHLCSEADAGGESNAVEAHNHADNAER